MVVRPIEPGTESAMGPFEGVRYLSPAELIDLLSSMGLNDYDLIDVRRIDEYAAGHIEGAKLIPLDVLDVRSDELDRNKVSIIYCKTGKRCVSGAKILEGKGWRHLLILEGGYDAYRTYLSSLR